MDANLEVPVESLSSSPHNTRSDYDVGKLKAFAAAIKEQGIINALLVRPMAPAGAAPVEGVVSMRYELVCGHRRLAAAKLAGFERVPVRVQNLTDAQVVEKQICENDQREDYHPIDRAEGYRLLAKFGHTGAQIAEKVGRSKAHVLSAMKLCDLIPEAKRAARLSKNDAGSLLPSLGERLALVPVRLQSKALKRLVTPDSQGNKPSFREGCEILKREFMIDLEKVPWDVADKSLVPRAGDCISCPKRAGCQKELFEETSLPDWQCMDPECKTEKDEAHWKRLVDDGEHNRGPKCLTPAEARKALYDNGEPREDGNFIKPTAVCYDDLKQRQYSQLIGKSPRKHFMLARSSTGELVELLHKASLKTLLEEAGKIERRKPAAAARAATSGLDEDIEEREHEKKKSAADERKRTLRAQVIRRTIGQLCAKVEKREPDKKFWRFLAETLFHQGALDETLLRRGFADSKESPRAYLDRMNEGQLRAFVFEGSLEFELYGDGHTYSPRLKEVSAYYSVDVHDVETEIFAAEKAKPTVKKSDAKRGGSK